MPSPEDLCEVLNLIEKELEQKRYGPFMLIVRGAMIAELAKKYANRRISFLERLLETPRIKVVAATDLHGDASFQLQPLE